MASRSVSAAPAGDSQTLTAREASLALRAFVIALKAYSPKSNLEIAKLTGLHIRTVQKYYGNAVDHGFKAHASPLTLSGDWLLDKPRSGRPPKRQTVRDLVIAKVKENRHGREKTTEQLAKEISHEISVPISAMTIWRTLKENGFNKTKPTRKPGLTAKMRKERLDWCLAHQNWTLNDWKKVIWSDETSVAINHRRGSYRVWRQVDEAFNKTVVRERWKGFSEFMFWGCFTYNEKGPSHCWLPESAKERKAAEVDIAKLNIEIEPHARLDWELSTSARRINLTRQTPGRKPQWRWSAKTGKLARGTGKGIDWYRYRKEIILPKLIPFAQRKGHDTLVQEDNAPAHSHWYQAETYRMADVQRLLWCANSPDLNAIEPAWMWMKLQTTKYGPPQSKAEAIRRWRRCWAELPQQKIREWIERIPEHIQQVIQLEGGNEYREGLGRAKERRLVPEGQLRRRRRRRRGDRLGQPSSVWRDLLR